MFFFFLLVLISVKTGLSLWPWANVMVALQVEVAFHDILLVVPIVCACPTARGIGNLHQTAAVEEKPCPAAVGSMSPGAVKLVEEDCVSFFFLKLAFIFKKDFKNSDLAGGRVIIVLSSSRRDRRILSS